MESSAKGTFSILTRRSLSQNLLARSSFDSLCVLAALSLATTLDRHRTSYSFKPVLPIQAGSPFNFEAQTWEVILAAIPPFEFSHNLCGRPFFYPHRGTQCGGISPQSVDRHISNIRKPLNCPPGCLVRRTAMSIANLPGPAVPGRSIVLSHGYIGLLRPATSLRIITVYAAVVALFWLATQLL
jgi:hypothetical protein